MQTLDKAWAVAFALVRAALKKVTDALLRLRLDCHKKGWSSFTGKTPIWAQCGGYSVGEGRPPCRPQAV